jgi:hypothetical protein
MVAAGRGAGTEPHEHGEDDATLASAAGFEARVRAQARAARPFLVVGSASIVAGGIVAAVTRPTGFELGSWAAAYLVLVGGVAQIALGVGQAWLAHETPGGSRTRWELVAWNGSLALTLLGSLLPAPLLTTLGAVALVAALWLFFVGVRAEGGASNAFRVLYRSVIVVVLVGTPVGIALSWIRHG